MKSKPPDPALLELVETSPQPMALYDAAGDLLAASASAREDAGRLGYSIETLEELRRAEGLAFSTRSLGDGDYTLATHQPPPPIDGGESLLTSILDASPVALIVTDFEGRVLRWNPTAERLFGYSYEEVAGRVLPMVPASEMPFFENNRDLVRAGVLVSSKPVVRRTKDGKMIDLRLSAAPVRDAAGRVVAAAVVYEDMTSMNEIVRNLERSRAHLTHAMELASMGSWVLDFTDDSLTWSPETHRIHGTDPETFRPSRKAFRAMVHPDDLPRLSEAVSRAQRTGERYTVEHRLIRPDGELRHCRISAEPVKDESGRVVKLVGIVQDVTGFKQLQEQFLQAQKMEAAGRLAGGVAHDFNNLLTIINGHSELLLMRESFHGKDRDSLQAIHEAGLRASSLTKQLLTLGRKQISEYKSLDLNQVAEEGCRVFRRLIGEDIQLQVDLDPSPLPLRADPGQLHQVLLNLVVNAREAMPGGGMLTIRTRRLESGPPPEVALPQPASGPWAEFSVSDTGVGMDKQVMARLYEPFFTTKESTRHSGLGLPTVYSVIHQHGGAVTVDSEPGAGTTFSAYLPIREPAAGEPAGENGMAGRTSAKIVLVEDQPAVRAVVRAMLESLDYDVDEFASPEAALEQLAVASDFDLLVTDIVMPGINGGEVAKRARLIKPGLPVLFISGYAGPANDSLPDSGGPSDFLAKPFHPKDLAAKIAKLLPA